MRGGFSFLFGPAFREELELLQGSERSAQALREVREGRLRALVGQHRAAVATRSQLRKSPAALTRRTSGSSGSPVEVAVGRGGYGQLLAAFWRGLRWWGVEPGDPGLVVLGAAAGGPRRLLLRVKDRFLGAHRVFVDDGDGWLAEAQALLSRRRFTYVYGYPSALHELSAKGFRCHHPPTVVVVTGEPLFGFQRRSIGAAFQAPVVEEFGCTELGTVAFECPHHTLHLTAEQVWLEQGPAGAVGTSLIRRPVPVLRYPLDEPVREGTAGCPCGRALPGAVLPRRMSAPWQAFEAGTQRAAESHPLPGRFVVSVDGGWTLRVERQDADRAGVLYGALRAAVPGVQVSVCERLRRRAAGKFRYLEVRW